MNRIIEPVKSGQELVDEIAATTPPPLGVAVWWLGQSGYVVRSRDATVYIDPYLSEHLTRKYQNTEKPHVRMTASPIVPSLITHADLVLSTHKHSDHMDPETVPAILESSPAARYVVPRTHREHVLSWGIDDSRVLVADVDVPIELGAVTIVPQPAAHEKLELDESGNHMFMSYVIKIGGMTLFHSGDTVPYAGLAERLARHKVDVAFLPVNGRDARRHAFGTPGNCTLQEALAVCVVAGVPALVPHHYDMFTFNTIDITEASAWAGEAFPDLEWRPLECGDRSIFTPRNQTT